MMNLQIYKSTNLQIYKPTNYKSTNLQRYNGTVVYTIVTPSHGPQQWSGRIQQHIVVV